MGKNMQDNINASKNNIIGKINYAIGLLSEIAYL